VAGEVDSLLAARRLPPEALRAAFDPTSLTFDCTDKLQPLTDFVGQDRAISALQFGLGMYKPGYNIFVTGLSGTGKTSAILEYVRQHAEDRENLVRDWIYVHNFDEPDRPNAISLPRGEGRSLRDSLEKLLETVRTLLVAAFQSDDYERRRRELMEEGQRRAEALVEEARAKAEEAGFALRFGPGMVQTIPLKGGRPITPEEFQALSPDEQRRLQQADAPIHKLVADTAEQVRAIEREVAATIQDLDRKVVEAIVQQPFADLEKLFGANEEVGAFLSRLREHTIEHADTILRAQMAPSGQQAPAMQPDPFAVFQCNLFVDSSALELPPIVVESNPTFTNLFGRIDRKAIFGTYLSDHTMLRAGAVHRANGGYLIVNFADLVSKPGAWDGMKRVLRTGQVPLEDPMEQYGLLTPQALRPEPIPVDFKLVITGDPMSYFILSAIDEEFWEMFKVKADFDYQIARTPENSLAYAGFICATCERHGLRHFNSDAVAALIEHGSRLVEDQEKLSARFGRLRDIVVEADHWAAQAGADRVSAEHVQKAIDQRIYRLNLIEERIHEMIARGTLIIDTQGGVPGQVNGLAVAQLGDHAFGRPSRITASTQLGQRGVVSIDRESQLSGKIHDKGVLTMTGYLGARYGHDRPLSLSATISFEQGYDQVDGDSASLAETCAVLTALAGTPVRQDLSITGSMNQKGEAQPIGGVNLKIEGFFDVCNAAGLTGEQGVIIPSRNRQNLMLRHDVLAAIREEKFHVYEVNTVDEALSMLTGMPAGEPDSDGKYPEGTVNHLVDAEIQRMGVVMRRFGRSQSAGEATPAQPAEEPKPEDQVPNPELPD
jgi:lon-related putative ATP-dependent protease